MNYQTALARRWCQQSRFCSHASKGCCSLRARIALCRTRTYQPPWLSMSLSFFRFSLEHLNQLLIVVVEIGLQALSINKPHARGRGQLFG